MDLSGIVGLAPRAPPSPQPRGPGGPPRRSHRIRPDARIPGLVRPLARIEPSAPERESGSERIHGLPVASNATALSWQGTRHGFPVAVVAHRGADCVLLRHPFRLDPEPLPAHGRVPPGHEEKPPARASGSVSIPPCVSRPQETLAGVLPPSAWPGRQVRLDCSRSRCPDVGRSARLVARPTA